MARWVDLRLNEEYRKTRMREAEKERLIQQMNRQRGDQDRSQRRGK